jgi:hypothetical protein
MLDLSFFLGPLLESTSGHWLGGLEARKNFENDVRLFLEKQKRDTSLDVFFFANRLDIQDLLQLEQKRQYFINVDE